MAQQPMYPALANSPGTEISTALTSTSVIISVLDATKLPAAPNLLTIGTDDNPETVLYTGKSGNNLTGCTRGFNGTTAQEWVSGSKVARYFTAYDHDAFRGNIVDHEGRIELIKTTANAAATKTETDAKFTVVNEQLAERVKQSELDLTLESTVESLKEDTATKSSIPSQLRITMHYNYEDNPQALVLLKSLGFNVVIVGKYQDSFTQSTDKTLDFLDKLYAAGVFAILHIDTTRMNSSDFALEQQWVSAVEKHDGLLGFLHYDEPIDQNIAIDTQELMYTRIKSQTKKPVYLIDPLKKNQTYTPNAYDVFISDIYTNYPGYDAYSPQIRKRFVYYRYLLGYKRHNGKNRPKRFIPMFPTFYDLKSDGATINSSPPTFALMQELLDCYAVFGISDYATFAFNITNPLFVTIERNKDIQQICHYIRSNIYNNKQDIVYISGKSFKMHKNHVSSTNIEYGSEYDTMYTSTGFTSGEIVVRLDRASASNEIYASCLVVNAGDSLTRTLRISASFDGTTYEQVKDFTFGPTLGKLFPEAEAADTVIAMPVWANTAYIKYEMAYAGAVGNIVNPPRVGFKEVTCTIL